LNVITLPVGIIEANCYIVSADASDEAVVIDPGGDADTILQAVGSQGLRVALILDTHGHPDHTAANRAVKEATGARLLVHEADQELIEGDGRQWALTGLEHVPSQADGTFSDGDELRVGDLTLRIYNTPGHTPGSCCIAANGVVFTGDTLFAGSIGRTDFPGGDPPAMKLSLARIIELFPDETVLYPGHGEATTLGEEKQTNPWLG
jgi:glyoxylase-like metal-dependent hydrolase (beta-lactamase superfamily II)